MTFPTPQEWNAAEGDLTLPDVGVGLAHIREDLEMCTEAMTTQLRHADTQEDTLELHAIQSDVSLAWAYTLRAAEALTTYLGAKTP